MCQTVTAHPDSGGLLCRLLPTRLDDFMLTLAIITGNRIRKLKAYIVPQPNVSSLI